MRQHKEWSEWEGPGRQTWSASHAQAGWTLSAARKRMRNQIRKTLLTLNMRNILVMLRLMNELCTRVAIHIKLNLKTPARRGGGCPKASKHKMAVHWKCKLYRMEDTITFGKNNIVNWDAIPYQNGIVLLWDCVPQRRKDDTRGNNFIRNSELN